MSDTEIDEENGSTAYKVVVPVDFAGERADRLLSRLLSDLSRTRIKELIETGFVSVAAPDADAVDLVDPTASLPVGSMVFVSVPPPPPADPTPEAIPLSVVFEDESLIVIDKPAGMVVHPAPGAWTGTLVNALLAHCGDSLSGVGGVRRPGIVHRIDKDTSGLIVVAKSDKAHAGLSVQFANHSIHRAYAAVVYGAPAKSVGTVNAPIGRNPRDRKKMAVVERGKTAVTHYRTLESLGPVGEMPIASVVECTLETGRTHQIRVHMTHIGHPLIGDPVYGRRRQAMPAAALHFSRQALHARTLGFDHPVTGACLSFASNVPDDMQDLIDSLGER